LIDDPDRDVREKAISALGQIPDPRAIVPLVPALLDLESSVRGAAEGTLHRLDPNWAQNKDIRRVLPKILKAWGSADYWVHHSAVKLLELLKVDPQNPPAEFAAARREEAPQETAPHPALAILADLLADRDRDFRLAAAVALGRLRQKSAGTMLNAALRDADDSVREAAQAALAALN